MRICNSRGTTLIETVIAAAIVVGLGAVIAVISAGQMKGLESVGNADARSVIYSQLSNTISETISMTNTAGDSSNAALDFNQCVFGGAGVCTALGPTGATLIKPVRLFDSSGLSGAMAAGVPSAEVRYNLSGELCLPTDPLTSCPYKVTAAYAVDCNGAATCTQARRLRVTFLIHQDDPVATRTDVTYHSDTQGMYELVVPFSVAAGGVADYVPLGTNVANLSPSSIHQPATLTEIDVGTQPGASANLTTYGNTFVGGLLSSKTPFNVAGNINVTGTIWNYWGDFLVARNVKALTFFVGYSQFYPTANGDLTVFGSYTGEGPVISHGAVYANGMQYFSDRDLKRNISDIPDVVRRVDGLTGYTFNWRENNEADIGFIAQNVETVFPELVGEDADGHKTVRYGNLIAAVLEAYRSNRQQQAAVFSDQDRRLREIDKKISLLESGPAPIKSQDDRAANTHSQGSIYE